MVIETGNPNFRAASCCNVEVVKGGEGDFFAGLVTQILMENQLIYIFQENFGLLLQF